MSFWGNSTGQREEIVEEIKPIPAKTIVKCMFEEVVYVEGSSEYGTNEHIKGTLVVIDGPYKNRKIFSKLHINNAKEEKAQVHIDALMRLFLLTKTPVPKAQPTGGDLMKLTMKPISVRVEEWAMKGKKGNWVSAYYPHNYVPPIVSEESTPDIDPDDDIPF